MSDYELVHQFTQESNPNIQLPIFPEPMSREEVVFLLEMMLSEMCELALTVTDTPDEAVELVRECVGKKDPPKPRVCDTHLEMAADQADALVDSWYYSLNAACKKGMNLSQVFQAVHAANMAKRDPKTGTFLRREDGKILKPAGWKEPDIEAALLRDIVDSHNWGSTPIIRATLKLDGNVAEDPISEEFKMEIEKLTEHVKLGLERKHSDDLPAESQQSQQS